MEKVIQDNYVLETLKKPKCDNNFLINHSTVPYFFDFYKEEQKSNKIIQIKNLTINKVHRLSELNARAFRSRSSTSKLEKSDSFKSQKEGLINKVGGKCLNLIRLKYSHSGFYANVPRFFCVNTNAFCAILSQRIALGDSAVSISDYETNSVDNDKPSQTLEDFINHNLGIIHSTEDFNIIAQKSKEIREKIISMFYDKTNNNNVNMKRILLDRLSKCGLSKDKFYSVRSSGVAEDLPGYSFAGQMDTFLNVPGEPEVIVYHIFKCYASLFSQRAVLYRKNNNFTDSKYMRMAVIIQEMVRNVHSSGIGFSANPMTQNRDSVLINCSYGMGEGLVSGLVNPDEFEVSKENFVMLKKKISKNKNIMIVCDEKSENNGKKQSSYGMMEDSTREEEVDQDLRDKQTIDDKTVIEIAKIIKRIEEFYDCVPQDVEFTVDNEKRIHILQAREITNLLPLPRMLYGELRKNSESYLEEKKKRVLFSLNRNQVVSEGFSPVGSEMVCSLYAGLLQAFKGFQTKDCPNAKYRVYQQAGCALVDITDLLGHSLIRKIFKKIGNGVDNTLPVIIEMLEKRKFFDENNKNKVPKMTFKNFWVLTLSLIPIIFKCIQILFFQKLDYLEKNSDKMMESLYKKRKKKIDNEKNDHSKIMAISDMLYWDYEFNLFPKLYPYVACGMTGYTILEHFVNDKVLMRELSSGISLNSKMMQIGMEKMSFIARHDKKLMEKLEDLLEKNKNKPIKPEEIRYYLGEFKEFVECYNKFIERFGVRGLVEIEISKKRFIEDSKFLLHFIVSNRDVTDEIDPEIKHLEEIKKGEMAIDKIADKMEREGKWKWWNLLSCFLLNFLRVIIFRRLAKMYRAYFKYREDPKQNLMESMYYGKKIYLEYGRKFVKKNILEHEDDVFFLTSLEISNILKKGFAVGNFKEKIKLRKKEVNDYKKFNMPALLLSNGENLEIEATEILRKDLPKNVLLGYGVAPGTVEGRVKLVLDPQKDTIEKSEILVSTQTDPTFSALFTKCVGIISSVGGMMTHGSVVAREVGIPCVVNVLNVTNILKNGMLIKMDGSKGTIEIIE